MSVFDSDGHVEIDNKETMAALAFELYEGQLGKWRGELHMMPTADQPRYALEMNPEPDRPGGGFTVRLTDHLQKLQPFSLGYIVKMTASEYADYQAQQS